MLWNLTVLGVSLAEKFIPEDFLETKYGKEWRTPKKEWNVSIDDGSIIRDGNSDS